MAESTQRIAIHNENSRITNQAQTQIFNGPVMMNSSSPQRLASPSPRPDDLISTLAFPEMFQRFRSTTQPHGNTCLWIPENDIFSRWEEKNTGIFWLVGKPGSGKSTAMSFLYRRHEKMYRKMNRTALQFFFDARGTELQRSYLGLLRALLLQLCHKDPYVYEMMHDIYADQYDAMGCPGRLVGWTKEDLERYFEDALVASALRNPVTIFIDALDEVGEQSASELVFYLARLEKGLAAVNGTANISISCRSYPVLAVAPGFKLYMETHNDRDIAEFINYHLCLASLPREGGFKMEKPLHSLALELTKMAQGVSLWPKLTAPLVRKRIIEGQCLEEIHDWLGNVPQELSNTYCHILESVIDSLYLEESIMLFQWVCLTETPLSVTELRYAMAAGQAIEPFRSTPAARLVENNGQMASKINAWSGGLVEISPEDQGYAQPIHPTVIRITQGLGLLTKKQATREDAAEWNGDLRCQSHLPLYRSCVNHLVTEFGKLKYHQRGGKEQIILDIFIAQLSIMD